MGAAGRDQPGDAAGEHAGLARSGAGDDEQLADRVPDGLALGVVEVLEQRLRPGRCVVRTWDARGQAGGGGLLGHGKRQRHRRPSLLSGDDKDVGGSLPIGPTSC